MLSFYCVEVSYLDANSGKSSILEESGEEQPGGSGLELRSLVTSTLDGGIGVGIVDFNITSNFFVDGVWAPALNNRTLHGLQAALSLRERHGGKINITRVVHDAHLRSNGEELFQVVRGRNTQLVVSELAGALGPLGGLSYVESTLNSGVIKVGGDLVIKVEAIGVEVSVEVQSSVASAIGIIEHIRVDRTGRLDAAVTAILSLSTLERLIQVTNAVLNAAVDGIALQKVVGVTSVASLGVPVVEITAGHHSVPVEEVQLVVEVQDVSVTRIAGTVAVSNRVTEHQTTLLQVGGQLAVAAIGQNLVGQRRNVHSSIRLSGHPELVLSELGVDVKEALKEHVAVNSGDVVVGLIIGRNVGSVRVTDTTGGVDVDHVGQTVPRVVVRGQVDSLLVEVGLDTERTVLKEETITNTGATRSTLKPEDNGILCGVGALRGEEPVEDVLGGTSQVNITGVLIKIGGESQSRERSHFRLTAGSSLAISNGN